MKPSGVVSPVAATPQGQGYNPKITLILPNEKKIQYLRN
jgi:hypothetical protein